MIKRILENLVNEQLFQKKVLLLYGPRQVGKTTLLKKIISDFEGKTLFLNADDPTVFNLLNRPNTMQLRQLIADYKLFVIDEAQQIPEIGLTSKLIVDTFEGVQLILSGSSSFELASRTQEPLTGRKRTLFLFPISFSEWQNHVGFLQAEQDLENRLVFGFYPEILKKTTDQSVALRELTDSYLYKDVLMYGNLKRPDEIKKLLQALAFQLGSEVSYAELSAQCGLDPKTVERYIEILEKAFIIFRLQSFSRNLRNEIKKGRKIYFYDNGIRNAVINQLQFWAGRQDKGALWENFLVSERLKHNSYGSRYVNTYFWRTTQQQEIDFVEEINGKLMAYEFKWNEKKNVRFPASFLNEYHPEVAVIHRNNFRNFVMD
ncbi:MAG: ATP-binding protein [Bacteroidales bacterium]|jgi:predicted AAA+ superfamily ATPase|nr:ATP-binding protein [Bacteroidales bacterium]